MGHLGLVLKGDIEHYVGFTAGGRPQLTLHFPEAAIFETASDAQTVGERLTSQAHRVSTREVNRAATVRLTLTISPVDQPAPDFDRMVAVLKQHGVQWSTTYVPGGNPPSYTAWVVVPGTPGVWESQGDTPTAAVQNALDPLFRSERQAGYEGPGGRKVRELREALGDLSPR